MDSLTNNSFKCLSCGSINNINLNASNNVKYNRTDSLSKRLKNFDYAHLNELEKLLVEFTVEVLSKKPNQLYLYANEYFGNKSKIQSTNSNLNDLDQQDNHITRDEKDDNENEVENDKDEKQQDDLDFKMSNQLKSNFLFHVLPLIFCFSFSS
jgi:hypothetical protein